MDRETLQAKLEKLEELERRIGYYEDREDESGDDRGSFWHFGS